MKHGESLPQSPVQANPEASIPSAPQKSRAEIFLEDSDRAKNVLPFLTLDKLSPEEKADTIKYASMIYHDFAFMPPNSHVPPAALCVNEVGENLASITGQTNAWENGEIPPETAQARKLFCATLFDAMAEDEDAAVAWKVYEALFSLSPNIASNCGGLDDCLELLTIAETNHDNHCTRDIYEEIIYTHSFSKENGFQEILSNSSPIEQLRLLPIYRKIALSCGTEGYTRRALGKIRSALADICEPHENKSHNQTTPLVKIAAKSIADEITREINTEWVDVDPNDPKWADAIAADQMRRQKDQEKQDELHLIFRKFPDDQRIAIIAPGIGASLMRPQNNLGKISDQNGNMVSLLNPSEDNLFNLNREDASLLSTAHRRGVKQVIDKQLGINLETISLDSQIQLLRFMTEADNKRFGNLCNTLQGISNESLKIKLLENFTAAEFGDDFGDALLDIAGSERFSNEQKERILDDLTSAHTSISKIAQLFKSFSDKNFAKSLTRASSERLTDIVTAFKAISENGRISANLGEFFGQAEFGYKDALEALEYESKSLDIISGTVNDIKNGEEGSFAEVILPPTEYRERTIYNFYSKNHGYVLLYTRPEASSSFDEYIEYGKRGIGVEASISFIVNPKNPFTLPTVFKPDPLKVKRKDYYNPATMDAISALRLDREGRAPNTPAQDPNRNPLNSVGTISVDLAAINSRADTPSGKIARLIAVGNQLRHQRKGTNYSLNHNTAWFDQKTYGTATGFKLLVKHIDTMATQWCQNRPPTPKDESFLAIKKAYLKQERAKKVLRVMKPEAKTDRTTA